MNNEDFFKKYKVCAVIVTYGNRGNLVKEVIKHTFDEGVSKIILVDNNSSKESKEEIKNLKKKYKHKIKVISLKKNTGSAGGFRRGLEEFLKNNYEDYDFVWLLDDDNVPLKNSLKNLILSYEKLSNKNNKKVIVVSFREPYKWMYKIHPKKISLKKIEQELFPRNRFSNFHFIQLPLKIIQKVIQKNNYYYNSKMHKYIEVPGIGYGGMLIKRGLIKKNLLPNEKYYVYSDDYEWCFRLRKKGIKIYLIIASKIKDIDHTYNTKKKFIIKTYIEHIFFNENETKVYYSIRNKIILEKKYLINNKAIYFLNKYIFLYVIWPLLKITAYITYFKKRKQIKKRINIIERAIKNGIKRSFKSL